MQLIWCAFEKNSCYEGFFHVENCSRSAEIYVEYGLLTDFCVELCPPLDSCARFVKSVISVVYLWNFFWFCTPCSEEVGCRAFELNYHWLRMQIVVTNSAWLWKKIFFSVTLRIAPDLIIVFGRNWSIAWCLCEVCELVNTFVYICWFLWFVWRRSAAELVSSGLNVCISPFPSLELVLVNLTNQTRVLWLYFSVNVELFS